MIPKGLFTQIGLLAIAVAIVFTYIQPRFAEIGEVQDDIVVYQTKRNEVVTVNSKLASLVSRLESVSIDDERKLLTYLPEEIDGISVVRDLYFISQEAGVLYQDSSFNEESRAGRDEDAANKPKAYSFALQVEGSYEQIKELLKLIEMNDYPLEVHSLNLSEQEGGFLSADLELVTYTFNDGSSTGNR